MTSDISTNGLSASWPVMNWQHRMLLSTFKWILTRLITKMTKASVQLTVIGNKDNENMTRNCEGTHNLIPDRVMTIHTISQ